MKVEIVGLLLFFKLSSCANLISNYSFQSPILSTNSFIVEGATAWSGHHYDLLHYGNGIGFGQYIDMQRDINQNGYIQQTVNLQDISDCILNFYYYPYDTNFNSYILDVYWNSVLISTLIPNIVQATLSSFQLLGVAGNNTLKFQEIGDSSDSTGMYIDQVVLQCNPINITTSVVAINQGINPNISAYQKLISIFSIVFSIPLQQIICIRYAYLFVQDVQIYYYNNMKYSHPLETVFYVVIVIQQIKFKIFDQFLGWSKFQKQLTISDYKPFTKKRFLQIQGSSSVLLQSNFSFFVYVLPLNLLVCLVLYILFKLLRNYKVSVFFRKFSFFKETLIQSLIQGNIVYFTYVCLGHLSFPWSFRFVDKLYLVQTVLFFFLITLFTISFFFIVGALLQKKSSYFIYCFYRTKQSFLYLTINNLRNFSRGFIFFYLQQFYDTQILLLIIIEVVVIIACIILECSRNIYTIKQFFCLELIYHLLFGFLNFALYCEYWIKDDELKNIAIEVQEFLIYLLIIVALLTIFLDLLPINLIKRSQKNFNQLKQDKKEQKNENKSSNLIKLLKDIQQFNYKNEKDEKDENNQTKVIKFKVKYRQNKIIQNKK